MQEELYEADQYGKGTTFFFHVNNVPVFCGGQSSPQSSSFFTDYVLFIRW
jgi:beta-mannosidase